MHQIHETLKPIRTTSPGSFKGSKIVWGLSARCRWRCNARLCWGNQRTSSRRKSQWRAIQRWTHCFCYPPQTKLSDFSNLSSDPCFLLNWCENIIVSCPNRCLLIYGRILWAKGSTRELAQSLKLWFVSKSVSCFENTFTHGTIKLSV